MRKRNDMILRPCTSCGCNGRGSCGRLIAPDGSVWPIRDTGIRFRDGKLVHELHAQAKE